jgi:hypothetical protein
MQQGNKRSVGTPSCGLLWRIGPLRGMGAANFYNGDAPLQDFYAA